MEKKHQKHWGIGSKAQVSKGLSIRHPFLKPKLHKLLKTLSLKSKLPKSKLPRVHLPKPISSWLSTRRHKFFLELSLSIVLIISSYIVIAHQLALRRYHLLPAVVSAVGPADTSLLSKVHFVSKDSSYTLTAPKTPASTSPSLSIGSTPNQPGYSFSLPTHLNKGISVTDPASDLSMEMTPTTPASTGHKEGDHYVYPLSTSGSQDIYTVKANGLEEDIAIPKGLNHSLTFNYTLKLPSDLIARESSDGVIGIYSADQALFGNITYGSSSDQALVDKARQDSPKNTLVFALPAPVIEEAGRPNYPSPSNAKASYTLHGNNLSLVINVSKQVTGPILIDPSIVVASASSFSTGNNEGDISINSTNNTISEAGLSGGSVSAGWSSTSSLPTGTYSATSVAYNGYVYEIGGTTNGISSLANVYYAPINSNSTLGSWTATTSLPAGTEEATSVVYNGYVYEIGGYTTGYENNVYYAPINSNGTLGSWTATTSLGANTSVATSVVYNGYVYEIDGYNASGYVSTVDYAPINSNGTLGSWTATTSLPSGTDLATSVVYNGYVYEIGGGSAGSFSSSVYYAPINSNGTLGSWLATSSLTTAEESASSVVYNGYVYEIGGAVNGGELASTYYAPINSNGTLGSWLATSSFNNARYGETAVAYNGYLYVIGGYNSSSGSQTFNYNGGSQNYTVPAGVTSLNVTLYGGAGGGSTYGCGSDGGETQGTLTVTPSEVLTVIAAGAGGTTGGETGAAGGYGGGGAGGSSTGGDGHVAGDGGGGASQILNGATLLAAAGGGGGCGGALNTGGTGGGTAGSNGTGYYGNSGGTGGTQSSDGTGYSTGGYLTGGVGGPSTDAPYDYGGGGGGSGYYGGGGGVGTATGGGGGSAFVPSGGTSTSGINNSNGSVSISYSTSSNLSDTQYAPIDPAGVVSGWTATSSLSTAASAAASVVYNGYIYILGGSNNSNPDISTVEYAAINSNGTLGSWSSTTSLTAPTYGLTAVAYNGYIYDIAGYSAGYLLTTVEYAAINSNGTLGSWTATTSLPTTAEYPTSAVNNGYVYLIGGYSSSGATTAVYYAPINSNGTLGSWTATTSLPTATYDATSVLYDGYVYEIGGNTGSGTAAVHYAPINSNGTLGSWTATTSLPTATFNASSVVYNGYVYEIGGWDAGSAFTTVECAAINSNGTLGSWTATTSLLAGTFGAGAVVYNGYVYEVGGYNSSYTTNVDYTQINNGGPGTVSGWTATTSLSANTELASSVAYNGYIYEIGGANSSWLSTVDYAPINSNGTLGSWTATTSLPAGIESSSSVAYNGYVYEIGGFRSIGGVSTIVDYAPINTNGTLGSWSATSSLPTATEYTSSVVYNGYVYELAGQGNTNNALANVYYASINSNGTLGSWTATTSVPSAIDYASFVAYNGYVYEVGGEGASYLTTVNYAPINSNGTIGSWTPTTSLLVATDASDTVAYNGYIYTMGGGNSIGVTTNVEYAPINSNGTIGSWTPTISLSGPTLSATAVAYNGYVYEMGGYTGSGYTAAVDYAGLQSIPRVGEYSRLLDLTSTYGNGTVGTWTTNGTSFTTARYGFSALAYNGYLYIMGGYNGSSLLNDVQYAPINSNGSIGSWTTNSTSFTTAREYFGAVAFNGYLYIMGGSSSGGDLNDVQYAPINSNGSIGSWTTNSTSFTTARYGLESVAYDGYLYIMGGNGGTGGYMGGSSSLTDTQYAPISSSGSVGSWTTTSTMDGAVQGSVTAYNGYLYLVGGFNEPGCLGCLNSTLPTAEYASVNSSGTLGTWTTTSSLTSGTGPYNAVAYNGYLYVTGLGNGSASNTVRSSPISSSGPIGSWQTNSTSFTSGRTNFGTVAYNGYLYIMGGYYYSGGAYYLNDVQYAPIESDDVLPAKIVLNGSDSGDPGIGGASGLGTGGIQVSFDQASNSCSIFSAPGTLSTSNSSQLGSAFAMNFSTNGCGASSDLGRYVWVHIDLDDSQTASFPDINSNHTTIKNLSVYYHPNTTYQLRGGETLSNGGLQSLDTTP